MSTNYLLFRLARGGQYARPSRTSVLTASGYIDALLGLVSYTPEGFSAFTALKPDGCSASTFPD